MIRQSLLPVGMCKDSEEFQDEAQVTEHSQTQLLMLLEFDAPLHNTVLSLLLWNPNQ